MTEENFSRRLSIKTGNRLHNLRIGLGLSLEKVRGEIYNKYGLQILVEVHHIIICHHIVLYISGVEQRKQKSERLNSLTLLFQDK